MSRFIAALLVLSLAGPDALVGQSAAPATSLQPGARVRIKQVGESPRVAVLVARNSEELIVQGPKLETDEAVPLGGITRLEVSTGRHRNVLKGLGMGVGIGGVGGLIFGAVAYQPCTGPCFLAPSDRGESAALGGIVFGTLGLVVGGLVGLQSHDTWQRVPLDHERVAFAVSPRAAGTGLGVRLRF